jgi:tRNA(Ile)-lysidine synthase
VELGGGLVAECEQGLVRFVSGPEDAAPAPVALKLPGRARVGAWEVEAELRPAPVDPAGPELATLDAAALGGRVEVRTWRRGDRIRPLGMTGTKTLQDLFTDRGVPRSLRGQVPVVTVDGEIAWVAGVAVSEEFRLDEDSEQVAVLTARVIE